jgi:hypothetical protein
LAFHQFPALGVTIEAGSSINCPESGARFPRRIAHHKAAGILVRPFGLRGDGQHVLARPSFSTIAYGSWGVGWNTIFYFPAGTAEACGPLQL